MLRLSCLKLFALYRIQSPSNMKFHHTVYVCLFVVTLGSLNSYQSHINNNLKINFVVKIRRIYFISASLPYHLFHFLKIYMAGFTSVILLLVFFYLKCFLHTMLCSKSRQLPPAVKLWVSRPAPLW